MESVGATDDAAGGRLQAACRLVETEIETWDSDTSAAAHGVILGSGLARRLGLLADDGKWSVRYKAAPMLVSQLALMARSGIRSATVTCRPEHFHSVERLVSAAAMSLRLEVEVAVQEEAPGPGIAFARSLKTVPAGRSVLLLLADTIVDSISPMGNESWIEVAQPDRHRRWCEVLVNGSGQVEELVDRELGGASGGVVAVGLYYFHNRELLDNLESSGSESDPIGHSGELSDVLDAYRLSTPIAVKRARGWLDLGDASSIASATRSQHRTRFSNQIDVDEFGILRKQGNGVAFEAEARFMSEMPDRSRVLFPRVLDVADDHSEYSVEYLDYRTLAELFLYEPGTLSAWGPVVDQLIEQLRTALWEEPIPPYCDIETRTRVMYQDKVVARFDDWLVQNASEVQDEVELNGRLLVAGRRAMDLMQALLEPVCIEPVAAAIHGDLNFSNILFAPSAGIFRLLDPRGEFGGPGPWGDARYDAAKLRHSYNGMYDAIVHGLYSLESPRPGSYELSVGPDRSDAGDAMDAALQRAGFDLAQLRVIESSLFLSMLPLHADEPERQWVLYLRGLELLNYVAEEHESGERSIDVVG